MGVSEQNVDKCQLENPALKRWLGTIARPGIKCVRAMIRLYIEGELGINKIAEILGRSSRTPLTQIQKYSKALERSGFCPACRRARGNYESQTATKAII